MAVVTARHLGRLASLRDVMAWMDESRAIDAWAADLGLVVDWRDDAPGATIMYLGCARFDIRDEINAVHFQLRFG